MSDYFTVDIGGEERVIGGAWLPTTMMPEHLTTVFGDTPETNLIRRDDWKPTSLLDFCPPIKNQNGIGACNAFASVTALEICRAMKGLPYVELSPGDLYRRVSDGVDQGSLPERALKELMDNGTCTAANTPPLDWQRENPGARSEWPKYRILEALWCPTFEHAASAIQQGFAINCSCWWWKYDPTDSEGWLQDQGSGRRGGHSIARAALVNRNGKWGLKGPNSWSVEHAVRGYDVLPERRVQEGSQVFRLWAVRECVQEAGDFPSPRILGEDD